MHSSREKLIAVAVTLAMIMILCVTCMGAGGPAGDGWLGSDGADPTNIGDIYHMGKIGIGTTDPQEQLHIVGDVKIEGASPVWETLISNPGTDAGIILTESAVMTNSWNIMREGASSDFLIKETFAIGSQDRFFIEHGSGNVGIGTTSPKAKLEVIDGDATHGFFDPPPIGYFGTDTEGQIALIGDATPFSSILGPRGVSIGVYGSALVFEPAESWAGYFNGNLFANGNVVLGRELVPAEIHEEKLYVDGNIRVIGDIFKDGGTCNFVEEHPQDPTKEIIYACLEGPEAGTYIRGTAQLVDGEAVVNLPEYFSLVTSDEGLTVQLTPVGEWLQLYVVEKGTEQIVVREANGKNGEFDYLVQGVRKGYEDYQVIRDKE